MKLAPLWRRSSAVNPMIAARLADVGSVDAAGGARRHPGGGGEHRAGGGADTIAGVAERPGLAVKPESLQPTGAFKLRGAVNAVMSLPAEVRAAGVVTDSSGNHGQALAYAARRCRDRLRSGDAGTSPPSSRSTRYGRWGPRWSWSPRPSARPGSRSGGGMVAVPPFDHRDVIAGQATVGLEIVADCPDVACVLVPVGGGGLASGVATAVKALRPSGARRRRRTGAGRGRGREPRSWPAVQWPTDRTYRTAADGLRTAPVRPDLRPPAGQP